MSHSKSVIYIDTLGKRTNNRQYPMLGNTVCGLFDQINHQMCYYYLDSCMPSSIRFDCTVLLTWVKQTALLSEPSSIASAKAGRLLRRHTVVSICPPISRISLNNATDNSRHP